MEKQLYSSCQNGDVSKVKQLLNNPQINVNYQVHGQTPFFIACHEGHIEVVKLLLNDERVDINKEDKDHWTPFFAAWDAENIEVLKLLLSDERVDVNKSKYDDCWTPIFIACYSGILENITLVLNDKRFDINKVEGHFERTPFFIACWTGQIETVEYILASGSEVNLNIKDKEGNTAIDLARSRERDLGEGGKFSRKKRKLFKDCKIIRIVWKKSKWDKDNIENSIRISW